MFKKLFLITMALFMCAGVYAASDVFTLDDPVTQTPIYNLDSDGVIWSSAGLVNVQDFWLDIPTSSSISVRGSFVFGDVDNLKVSTTVIWGRGTSGRWTNGTTTYTTRDIRQPVYPVSILGCIVSTGIVDGVSSAYASITTSATMIVYGTNAKGETINETIKISTGVPGQTLQAFATISSFTITVSTINGINASLVSEDLMVLLGAGTIFGLSNNIEKKSDIYKVFESTGNVNVNNTTVNTAYDTIKFNNAPNATRDYFVWYRTKKLR